MWSDLDLESVQEASVLYQLCIDVMQLGNTDRCCLAHIWVVILHSNGDRINPDV